MTGATGCIGSHLVERLAADGHDVVAFVRSSSDTRLLRRLGVECRQVELTLREDVERAFEPFDRVFHLAAAFRTEHADVEEFRKVNVLATGHLLEAARQRGVGRFVHCSTVGVQGEIQDPPATEAYPPGPGDHYQETKLEGERLARKYMEEGLPGTVVRPVGVYGPRDRRFLKLFQAIDRRRFVMFGDGETLYHMTYVDDLVDGFLLAATDPDALGEVFTIAGPSYTTLNELVSEVARALGRSVPRWQLPYRPVYVASLACEAVCRRIGVDPPLFPRRVEFFELDRAFDISKARRVLGYQPEVELPEGLARTAAWYREHDWL